MAAYLFFFFAHVPWLFHLLEESLELASRNSVQHFNLAPFTAVVVLCYKPCRIKSTLLRAEISSVTSTFLSPLPSTCVSVFRTKKKL